jgi:hypothetical protein
VSHLATIAGSGRRSFETRTGLTRGRLSQDRAKLGRCALSGRVEP